MTGLDWLFLVVWVGIALSGFWKGAVKIVFGVGGFLAGVFAAAAVGEELASRLAESLPWVWMAQVLARLIPVLICVLIGLLAGWGLERTLKALHLGWLNRLAGTALAGALAALLLGTVLVAAVQMSPEMERLCSRSVLAPVLMKVPGLLAPPAEETSPPRTAPLK